MTSAPDSGSAPRVVVVGSVNRDYVCTVAELPRPGETVLSEDFFLNSGGKGANQAVAAARMGAATALIGSVGDDEDGASALHDLQEAGVDTADVDTLAGVRTGAAFVMVSADGENFIVVAPGANDRVSEDQTRGALSRRLRPADVLVTQAEIPLEALVCAVTQGDALGCRVVLNLAPYRLVPDDVLRRCDPLVVNEGEAAALLQEVAGQPPEDPVERAAQLGRLARSAVMTLGAEGAMLAQGEVVEHVRGQSVPVVDSTGAGDAFTGALAASLCRGDELLAAVRVGVAAGAYAVGRSGAQASFPRAADLQSG